MSQQPRGPPPLNVCRICVAFLSRLVERVLVQRERFVLQHPDVTERNVSLCVSSSPRPKTKRSSGVSLGFLVRAMEEEVLFRFGFGWVATLGGAGPLISNWASRGRRHPLGSVCRELASRSTLGWMSQVDLDAWVPQFTKAGGGLDRVSGLPFGLPTERWPRCGMCGVPLAFIGQLAHAPPRIDLGADGRVLYAFLCKNFDTMLECGLSAGVPRNTDGGHAVVVVDDAQPRETPAPEGLLEHSAGLSALSWETRRELVPEVAREHLLYGLHQQRSDWPQAFRDWEAQQPSIHRGTKVGGAPLWIQDPVFNDTLPDSRHFRYVAQWGDQESADGANAWTTLEAGRLYLLVHERPSGRDFELYYIGR